MNKQTSRSAEGTVEKLYKFRSLGSEIDYCRARGILETGKFWCSKFSELNDPMEGVFSITDNRDKPIERIVKVIYSKKDNYKICSLCGDKGSKILFCGVTMQMVSGV